jgi:hypothetical protein
MRNIFSRKELIRQSTLKTNKMIMNIEIRVHIHTSGSSGRSDSEKNGPKYDRRTNSRPLDPVTVIGSQSGRFTS